MTVYRRVLVVGGARSGKSRTALQLAQAASAQRTFIATAQGYDDEMRERIERHRSDRDGSWHTMEAPLELADAIRTACRADRVVLVDCLTLWLSNLHMAGRDQEHESVLLAEAICGAAGPLVLVSNEVGQGIVPATALGRTFRDDQGRLNQRIAEACEAVVFVAAGCPILLKPAPSLDLKLG